MSIEVIGTLLRIESTQTNDEIAQMLSDIIGQGTRVLSLREMEPDLEEAFMKITKGGLD
jgi:hypothetical protein